MPSVDLRTAVERLVGEECWSLLPGENLYLSLRFGRKVPLARPNRNPRLTAEEREFDGEFALYVECEWRLDRGTSVEVATFDLTDDFEKAWHKLRSLRGARVQRVVFFSNLWDLRIDFEGDWSLTIFCDRNDPEDHMANYSFFADQRVWSVQPRGTIKAS